MTEWNIFTIPHITSGIDRNNSPDLLQDGYVLEAKNVFFLGQEARVDTGYKKFNGVVRGTPQAIHQAFYKNGNNDLFLVTTDTFYRDTSSEWQYVAGTANTTTTATAAAGATSITVDSITGFSDNDFIGIILDNGKQHQTQVNGAPSGSTITFDDAIPAGRSVANGAVVVRAVVLSGGLDVPVDITTVPDYDDVVFANRKEAVQRYDGATCQPVGSLPSSGDTEAQSVLMWNARLFLLNTNEAGSDLPQRVRWAGAGDITDWASADAGFVDLWDLEDHIRKGLLLGPHFIVYRERSIARGTWLGLSSQLVQYETMVTDEGVMSTRTVVRVRDMHVLLGNDNIYVYKGGYSLTPIGDPIKRTILGGAGGIDPQFRHRQFASRFSEYDEVWFFHNRAGENNPKDMARFNTKTGGWARRSFPVAMTCVGSFISTTALTWANATGKWDSYGYPWNSRRYLKSFPTALLGGFDKQIYEYDPGTITDDGTGIDYEIITKDFFVLNKFLRVDHVEIQAAGTSLTVEYSIDEGNTWTTYGTLSPGTLVLWTKVFKEIVGRKVRFKIKGTGGGFRLRSMIIHAQSTSSF